MTLEILADRTHVEHAERIAWLGGPFDPESVDLAQIEAALAKIR
jgi:hypothetical protein